MSTIDPLVSADWLHEHLAAPDLVVLDCTVRLTPGPDGFAAASGRPEWAAAHIPGAGFGDLTAELCDPDSPLGFAVPTPEAFGEAMAALGVGDDSRVVLYDDAGMMWAARVWWMLRWIGFDNAALLDGGLRGWRDAGLPLDDTAPSPATGTLTVSARPDLIADKAQVLAAVEGDGTCLVDSLMPQMYSGEVQMYAKPGHIPGATNTPAFDMLDGETGLFRPLDELGAMFPDGPIITYCGGGIAASLDAFVLAMLGRDDVAVYTASLQEWTADPNAPMEV
ncbi:MAG: sulfurtransferase [Actinomycetota bacterium]